MDFFPIRSGKTSVSNPVHVQAEEKREGRGRRRPKITPHWSQPVAERTEGCRTGPAILAAEEPRQSTGKGQLGRGNEGRWVALGTRQAELGSEERERQTPSCLPPRIFSTGSTSFFPKPLPGGKARLETPFPTCVLPSHRI